MKGECPRCSQPIRDADALEKHLVSAHGFDESRAHTTAARYTGVLVPASAGEDHADHRCPSCGTEIACDWKTVADIRRQSKSLALIATFLEQKMDGTFARKPRVKTFDLDEARRLVGEGMSVSAVARALGASRMTLTRDLKK